MTIAESLKRFRKNFNLTQKQVATELQMSQQKYQAYEGKSIPSAATILSIANIFKVSTDYLLGLSDDPRPARIDDAEVRDALEFKKSFQKLMQEHAI